MRLALATRSADRRARSRAAISSRRARATAASVSRRVRSSSACARSRSAIARVTSPPLRLNSGNGSENPMTGKSSFGRVVPGSPLSKPNSTLGANRLARVNESARSAERRRAAAAATGRYSPGPAPPSFTGALSSGATRESTSLIAGLSPASPICSCRSSKVPSAVSESSMAALFSWPAFTAARRTSSSLTSPTSRRSRAIFRRLSASSAVRRESRACIAVARARV